MAMLTVDFEEARRLVQEKLSEQRYQHSLNVAKEAESLARLHGEDPEKARFAAMLHDVCKDEHKDVQLQRIHASGIICDKKALEQPALWHAMAGYAFLKEECGVQDEDILNAVRYHTTARAGMSCLEKVIYVADVTSEDRQYGDVDTVRALAHASLDKAMLYVLQYTVRELVFHKRQIVDDTCAAYNQFVR